MHNSPYRTKMPGHQSASSIKTFIDCEAQAAYQRYFINAPRPPNSIAIVFGKAMHKMVERMGKAIWRKKLKGEDLSETKGWTAYGVRFIKNVLDGVHGSSGETFPAEPIRFFSKRQSDAMTPQTYQEALAELKKKYIGKAWLALEAFRLEAIYPNEYKWMAFELDFSKHRIILELNEYFRGVLPAVKVNGVIDSLRMRKDKGYVIYDFKTGYITTKYRSREVQITDHQMTIYHLAMRKLMGRAPEMMFIQPLEIGSAKLKDHGPFTLREERIAIPPRTETHFEQLALLASDIYDVLSMVVYPERYSAEARNSYLPNSTYGQYAQFQKNVQEGRFVPRIGDRCESCDYLDACRDDHRHDWVEYEQNRTRDYSRSVIPIQLVEPEEDKTLEPGRQLYLLDHGIRKKSKYERKSTKELKKELLATGMFVHRRALKGALNGQVIRMLDLSGPCPCRSLNLVPMTITNVVPELPRGAGQALVNHWAAKCPYQECPRTKKEEGKVNE
ncbi:MAG: PD-(D/E)XK nuclease family protein [Candidatus Doudnabacteria bacterium]|nr:PD-(D/E)XK nuclease family protein [Candidatus Doudnabacteria bacterium]